MSEFNKDCYRTPRYVFNALNRKYRFDVDACASADNALCEKYFTENLDITKTEIQELVSEGSRVWMNPPYSNPTPFVQTAIDLMIHRDCVVVMLLPADKSTKWFSLALSAATEICDVIGGRINFFHPVTCEEVKGNNKGSMIVVFDPNSQSQIQTGVTLDFLKSRGTQ